MREQPEKKEEKNQEDLSWADHYWTAMRTHMDQSKPGQDSDADKGQGWEVGSREGLEGWVSAQSAAG